MNKAHAREDRQGHKILETFDIARFAEVTRVFQRWQPFEQLFTDW